MVESDQRVAGDFQPGGSRPLTMSFTGLVLEAAGFARVELLGGHLILAGLLPNHLLPTPEQFGVLWDMHPLDFHEIKMHGRLVKTPRWQQAFGHDYAYAGRVNRALPVPTILGPLLTWAQEVVDARLNGILVNWYEGSRRHYIGRHRDSIIGLVEGSPIVTISLGAERTFRLRPWPPRLR